jgi:addiction module HigA family antidote
MNMHNPPHPSEFIDGVYMQPYNLSRRALATHLNAAASTLSRIVKGQSAISPEMALRLSIVLGRTPESWLSMQDNCELWQALQT